MVSRFARFRALPFQVPDWTPSMLRIVIIGLVAPPGVGKFLTYPHSVAFFASLGIPSPGVTVLLVGVIELTAVGLVLADRAHVVVATLLVPVMVVAIWTTSDWQAGAVLAACVGLVALDVGIVAPPVGHGRG